eukprot:s1104_g32.t1
MGGPSMYDTVLSGSTLETLLAICSKDRVSLSTVAQGPPSPRISGKAEPAIAEPTDTKGLGTSGNQAPSSQKAPEQGKQSYLEISISVAENKSEQVKKSLLSAELEMFGSADCLMYVHPRQISCRI